ncbi:MAG: serine peptidase [Gammaproteobacteria bacterium]|nr:serine peptidase [Gammaproteobacteria bacterium]|tara:strand:- start:483 stop:1871 length:1389 start_codon:yes stop_codon:yes gene_type:complete
MTKFKIFLFSIFISALSIVEARELPNFSDLAEDASPAVVNITSTRTVSQRNSYGRGFGDPRYDEFFERFFGQQPRPSVPRENSRPVVSTGSGFIISSDGYLLTNNHVVEDADEVKVSLGDRREYKAEIIGTDPRSDVAVLKIDAEDLPTLKIGKSEKLRVGEWVVAIGSPFQLRFSVTSGIVSAKGRSIPNGSDSTYVPFIQTDVAINPGNSGGPLFNLDGEVIGINSQIYTRSGGYMGVSFAIPIDYAMDVADQLRENGYVARGWLGVSIQEVTSELAEALGMEIPKGALVSQIIEDSPAEKSGLKEEDVILFFDGEEIFYSSDLPLTVGSIRPESKVNAMILRDGKKKTVQVTVGELPKDPALAFENTQQNFLGLVVENQANDNQRSSVEGVLVTSVDPDGIAYESGIRRGDIIYSLARTRIENVNEFKEALSELDNQRRTTIGISRNGNKRILSLNLSK